MENAAGFGTGLVSIVVGMFLIIMAILTFLLPLFVSQIKNELTRIRKVMEDLSDELIIVKEERAQKKKILEARAAAARKNKKPGIKIKSWDIAFYDFHHKKSRFALTAGWCHF